MRSLEVVIFPTMNNTTKNTQIILTANPAAGNLALDEIQAVVPGARLRQWLAPGVGWVGLDIAWTTLTRHFKARPPVFCRHVCPVQILIPLKQTAADLADLAEAGSWFLPDFDLTQTCSVQTRLIGEGWPYASYNVNVKLAEELAQRGIALDVRQPAQILSVVLTPEQAYLGLSPAADNLSDWAGGARRFKRDEAQISRAEFKLLEAVEVFGLTWPQTGAALDLGAAPGGWTRLLRQHDLHVVAVDPANLDARLAADPAVRHIRQTAQSYLPKTREQFEVILNDMRLDAQDSARLMLLAAKNLRAAGWAVVTLKLPQRGMGQAAAAAIEKLSESYEVLGARQLFHNRNEITVALSKAAN